VPPNTYGSGSKPDRITPVSVYTRFHGHELPILVTSNIKGRQRLFESRVAVRMLLEVMGEVRRDTGFELHAWVVMPDHLHFIIQLRGPSKLGRVMQLIKGRFANRYNKVTGSGGNLWQSRYHARVLRSERALNAAIEYVHANPVVAGLVSEPEEFAWSSARRFAVEGRLAS
jgi:REP-associated tyrosine transposase